MSQFLSTWISYTKEPLYRVKVCKRGSLTAVREFQVKGSLSVFEEKVVSPLGEIYRENNYQFMAFRPLEENLTEIEKVSYQRGDLDFWLVDTQKRLVHLVLVSDYSQSKGIFSVCSNLVYQGHVEANEKEVNLNE